MSDTTENDDQVTELENRAYTAIAYIIRQLAQTYLPKIGDALTVNDTLLRTTAQLVGEMIACYPENERESVLDAVNKTITYSQAMMETELAERDALDEDKPVEPKAPGEYDLATMKTQGNC